MRIGLWSAVAAYSCWGLFPLYIKQLAQVPAIELVLHRSLWSLLFVMGLLAALRRIDRLAQAWRQPRLLLLFSGSALLLSTNWLIYVWAVAHDRVLDASLGYFINPLVNVVLGFLVLHERLRPLQWTAIALAGLGVLWLGSSASELPWIALALAGSFGLYGLLRKTAPLGAIEGLALETSLLAPIVVVGLAWLGQQGGGHFARGDLTTDLWLVAAGPVTAVPLLLFAAAARRVTLTTLGLLQYMSPTIQFVLGLWVFGEPFDARRAMGFAAIWLGLLVYSGDGVWQFHRTATAPRRGITGA